MIRLAPSEAAKVAKLIRLLDSDQPGEVLGTVAALKRTLATAGSSLHALADAIAPPTLPFVFEQPSAPPPQMDWHAVAKACLARAGLLNAKERAFVKAMTTW